MQRIRGGRRWQGDTANSRQLYIVERDHGLGPRYFAVYLTNVSDRSVVRVIRIGYEYDLSGHRAREPPGVQPGAPDGRSIAVTWDLAAVSVDPMSGVVVGPGIGGGELTLEASLRLDFSFPIFSFLLLPYGDIFSVDIDPDDLEKNGDLERFDRVTHSRYENSTPAWTVFSTHDPHAQWNLEVMEDEYTPACPYAHRDGGESWHMIGQMCMPKRTC
ncbi:hypothetical protein BS78_05G244700 [Paspalum vaginatum]|nr:hypothetical protein BS78_05G244700 [Paspalum vaginatum]